MKTSKILTGLIAALALLTTGLVAGCSDDNHYVGQKTASPSGVITGKVVDAHTGQGIANAQVKLVLGTDVKETTTAVGSANRGRFEFENVPVTDTDAGHPLKISAPEKDYMDFETRIPMTDQKTQSGVNTEHYMDIGEIALGQGKEIKVQVTQPDGTPLPNAPVIAMGPMATGENIADQQGYFSKEVTAPTTDSDIYFDANTKTYNALTNASGLATIKVNEVYKYSLYAPAMDKDNDKDYEYISSAFVDPSEENATANTRGLKLIDPNKDYGEGYLTIGMQEPSEVNPGLMPVAGSIYDTFEDLGTVNFATGNQTKLSIYQNNFVDDTIPPKIPVTIEHNQTLSIVFNYPIQKHKEPTITTPNVLQPVGDIFSRTGAQIDDMNKMKDITENFNIKIDNTGTRLNIAPKEGNTFPENEVIMIRGLVSSDLDSMYETQNLAAYVAPAKNAGLTSDYEPTLDNFYNSTLPGGPQTVFMTLPELVEGQVRLIKRSNSTDEYYENTEFKDIPKDSTPSKAKLIYTPGNDNKPYALNAQFSEMISQGAVQAGQYAVINLDNIFNQTDLSKMNTEDATYKIEYTFKDAEGNKIEGEKEFPVN